MQQRFFIADLIACSTCFGHHYAHHQELKSIIQWLLPVVFPHSIKPLRPPHLFCFILLLRRTWTVTLRHLMFSYRFLLKIQFLWNVNPLNAKLNPVCHLLALLRAHHILYVSRIRVKPCRYNFRRFERPVMPSHRHVRQYWIFKVHLWPNIVLITGRNQFWAKIGSVYCRCQFPSDIPCLSYRQKGMIWFYIPSIRL